LAEFFLSALSAPLRDSLVVEILVAALPRCDFALKSS
jgi:hypothetical protein